MDNLVDLLNYFPLMDQLIACSLPHSLLHTCTHSLTHSFPGSFHFNSVIYGFTCLGTSVKLENQKIEEKFFSLT